MLEAINHRNCSLILIRRSNFTKTLGALVSSPLSLPEHGVTVVFVELGESKVELLEPLGENGPIAAFLRVQMVACTAFVTTSQTS